MVTEEQTIVEFSKEIHEYLSHYVDVADAKAGILIGLASALIGFMWNLQQSYCLSLFLLIANIAELVAVAVAVYCVMPRLYTGGKGYIFWEDILSRKSASEYSTEVKKLSIKEIETDYAEQNYYLSKILSKKFSAVRISMIALIIGAIFLLLFLIS